MKKFIEYGIAVVFILTLLYAAVLFGLISYSLLFVKDGYWSTLLPTWFAAVGIVMCLISAYLFISCLWDLFRNRKRRAYIK